MKIFGIGTDIVNIKRIKKILKNNGTRFKNKIFSESEINYCEKKEILVLFMPKGLPQKKHLVKLWERE